ncbi:DNA-binding protein [Deltaproteobacteria bacterium Smac51]|nr:DNA-binding protein [Deltaproteobacteria bacterium Smac51]
MIDISEIMAGNLRRLREERKISLAEAARLAGVSKSLLSQIERGVVSPTITTVWKIANGLKVPFTDLTTTPAQDFEMVEAHATSPLIANDERFRNYPLFGLDGNRRFEIYYIELDPGAVLESEPHQPETQELITVFSGRLTLKAGDKETIVAAGVGVRFMADQPHSYTNNGDELCLMSMVIYYPK